MSNLTVTYEGKDQFNLNHRLVENQKLNNKDIENIKKLHIEKLQLFDEMKQNNPEKQYLKECAKKLEEIENKLQSVWKFKVDRNFHDWYEIPHCTCPKIDNAELKGMDRRIIDCSCLVHG